MTLKLNIKKTVNSKQKIFLKFCLFSVKHYYLYIPSEIFFHFRPYLEIHIVKGFDDKFNGDFHEKKLKKNMEGKQRIDNTVV